MDIQRSLATRRKGISGHDVIALFVGEHISQDSISWFINLRKSLSPSYPCNTTLHDGYIDIRILNDIMQSISSYDVSPQYAANLIRSVVNCCVRGDYVPEFERAADIASCYTIDDSINISAKHMQHRIKRIRYRPYAAILLRNNTQYHHCDGKDNLT